ncbi:hypothetical protein [Bergeyella sp. RCAD1439]|uniref:hypothetical protein n=1 Tax=Bergeyella anatis TaxID=3113737 RepID=UPI002E19DC80|nr:hypothetical protein [Bergeyella sp. RCAD1439]
MDYVFITFLLLLYLWIFATNKKIIQKKTSAILGGILLFIFVSYAGFVYLFHKHKRANKEYQRIIEEWNFYIYDNKNNPINNFKIIDLSNPEEPKIVKEKTYKNQVNLFNFVNKRIVIHSEGYIPDTIFVSVDDLNRQIYLTPHNEKKP